MATLVYSPGVRVVIQTIKDGIVDVTEDIVGGNVVRAEDSVSSASIRLANPNRKYDRVFTPNDTISIEMKRVRWMPVFTGYLTSVPYFSAWSREVELTASCTLKRLQHFYWDPYAPASIQLLDGLVNKNATDGGIRDRVTKIMTDVVGWERNKIHIGEVPTSWFENISDLYDAEVQRQIDGPQGEYINNGIRDALQSGVGAGPSSEEFFYPGSDVIPGIEGNRATGILPDSEGRAGAFGGEDGFFVSASDLTGEPFAAFEDDWYCAMRFPYRLSLEQGDVGLEPEEVEEAKRWWANRKLVIVSSRTNRAIVVRAAAWGPEPSTGHVVGISRLALGTLGIVENESVRIGFAAQDFPLGQYDLSQLVSRSSLDAFVNTIPNLLSGSDYTIPSGISSVTQSAMAWGGYQNGRISDIGALPNTAGKPLHFLAAEAMVAMQAAARKEGITLRLESGYRSFADQQRVFAQYGSPRAARPGTSRHGWGLAADITVNESFSSAQFLWLRDNARRFGWFHPSWARQGGSNPEPWHWEFWGIFGYPTSVSRLNSNPYYKGEEPPATTTQPAPSEGMGNSPQLFNFGLWRPQTSRESAILGGPIALVNDEPIMETLKPLINASMRKLASAPNGDFIAWFPDYFGVYGTAGKMELKTIELTDFTMNWSDENLKTHFFVTGANYGDPNLPIERIGGPVASIIQRFFTMGVASIEQDKIMQALFNIDKDSIFSKPLELLQRFGPRVHHIRAPTISSREAEFWLAIYHFQRNWASQFSTSVPMTFMPELYPGMLIQIPELGFQAYVTRVTHTFDLSQMGFTTTASIVAPSSLGSPGLLGLPRAGLRENAVDYEGTDY